MFVILNFNTLGGLKHLFSSKNKIGICMSEWSNSCHIQNQSVGGHEENLRAEESLTSVDSSLSLFPSLHLCLSLSLLPFSLSPSQFVLDLGLHSASVLEHRNTKCSGLWTPWPSPAPSQFLRLSAVDLTWHLCSPSSEPLDMNLATVSNALIFHILCSIRWNFSVFLFMWVNSLIDFFSYTSLPYCSTCSDTLEISDWYSSAPLQALQWLNSPLSSREQVHFPTPLIWAGLVPALNNKMC